MHLIRNQKQTYANHEETPCIPWFGIDTDLMFAMNA